MIASISLAMLSAQVASSNTNKVTQGLIEDDLVDSLDTGTEENNFLFFSGFDSIRKIESGIGKKFGSGLWISLFDAYYFTANQDTNEYVTKDSVAQDKVNIDYTNTTLRTSVLGNNRFFNDLATSFYFNNKFGATVVWSANTTKYSGYGANPTAFLTRQNGTTDTKNNTEDHTTESSNTTEYSKLINAANDNEWAVYFNGIQTPYLLGDLNFYVKLNSAKFELINRSIDLAYSTTNKTNGSTLGQTQPSYSGIYSYNTYIPKIEFETGFTLKKLFDVITPEFTLIENFEISLYNNKNSYDYERLTVNTVAATTKVVNSSAIDDSDMLEWNNTITPRFDFDFDLGERITLKARTDIPVKFRWSHDGAYKQTTITTTTATNNLNGDITTTVVKATSGENVQNIDSFSTSVTPTFSLGFVYQIVPNKFNLNMGVTASSGSLTWTKINRTNNNIPTISQTTTTNVAGETSVTDYTYTPAQNGDGPEAGDAEAESETNNFTAYAPSASASFGFTYFLSEKAQLDTYLLYGNSVGTTTPIWQLNVMFGLKL